MLIVLKNYISHSTVIGFFLFLIAGLYFITSSSLLIDNFYWFFVPIILAPFYEWYVHKYQLHAELTKKDGWYRRYQILLHHGHHRDPEYKIAICTLEILNLYLWTDLSFLFINNVEFCCSDRSNNLPSALSSLV